MPIVCILVSWWSTFHIIAVSGHAVQESARQVRRFWVRANEAESCAPRIRPLWMSPKELINLLTYLVSNARLGEDGKHLV
jgi:hypothetical protein